METDDGLGSGIDTGQDGDFVKGVNGLKAAQKQMVKQAIEKELKHAKTLGFSPQEFKQTLDKIYAFDVNHGMNETMVASYGNSRDFADPFVQEIFTDTEPIAKAARKKGYHCLDSRSLPEFDFFKRADRERVFAEVKEHKPFLLVLAFPCSPYSPIHNINMSEKILQQRETTQNSDFVCSQAGLPPNVGG